MYLLIDNYDSFTYNLHEVFSKLGVKLTVIKNDEYIDADDYSGIILSPGPSNPSNSGSTLKYLEKYTGVKPIFGVCLGMQSICYSLGFGYRRANSIMHGKVDTIRRNGNSILLDGLSNEFKGVRYHSLAVNSPVENISSYAESDNEIMSVEFSDKMLFGVQFHPESYLSEDGIKIAANFIEFTKNR